LYQSKKFWTLLIFLPSYEIWYPGIKSGT
jgi:hypothetical protein